MYEKQQMKADSRLVNQGFQPTYAGDTVGRNYTDAPPTDPGIKGKLMELLNYLGEAEREQSILREALLGPSPELANGGTVHSEREPSIDELLMRACHQAACLVGESKSINARL